MTKPLLAPTTETIDFAEFKARHDVARLIPENGVAVELGVAQGIMSERILETARSCVLYSVHAWAGDRLHDTNEYKQALRRLSRFAHRNVILRMRFDEALDLFKDESLDFIYVDGYAHTGEEGGQTFADWWPKLKPGGIMAGDDYDPDQWPLVVSAVDRFVAERGLEAFVIPFTERGTAWCEFPTWFTRKPARNQ